MVLAAAAAAKDSRPTASRSHPSSAATSPASPQAYLTRYLDLSGLRWTVDRPEDLPAFVRAGVSSASTSADPGFGLGEILEFLDERPDLATLGQPSIGRSIGAEKKPVAVAA